MAQQAILSILISNALRSPFENDNKILNNIGTAKTNDKITGHVPDRHGGPAIKRDSNGDISGPSFDIISNNNDSYVNLKGEYLAPNITRFENKLKNNTVV